jgi:hypothetical protein
MESKEVKATVSWSFDDQTLSFQIGQTRWNWSSLGERMMKQMLVGMGILQPDIDGVALDWLKQLQEGDTNE